MLSLTVKDGQEVVFTFKGGGLFELMLQLAEVSLDYAFYRDIEKSIGSKMRRDFESSRVVKKMIRKK